MPLRPATSPARRPRRRWARRLGWALAGLAVALLVPVAWVQLVGQSAVVASPRAVTPHDVAIVLGAGLQADGSPSPYLRRRLDAAADLYARGAVRTVLVSGDGVSPGHDEPGAMRTWLLRAGVPDAAIELDRQGLDTTASCVRAHDLLDATSAVVVTQDYHLRRAVFSCRQAGIDTVGIGVSAASVTPLQAVVWHVRELPASLKAAWDAVTR